MSTYPYRLDSLTTDFGTLPVVARDLVAGTVRLRYEYGDVLSREFVVRYDAEHGPNDADVRAMVDSIRRIYDQYGPPVEPAGEASTPEPTPEQPQAEQPEPTPEEVLTPAELDRARAVIELIKRRVYTDEG